MRIGPTGSAVFLGASALLVAAAAPGLYLRDAGELSTAAFTLGVAHETGFPLWCLLAKAATFVPLGEVALRITLLSALCGALAGAGVFCLVRDLLLGAVDDVLARTAGLTAAGLLVADYTFWKQATVAEVYTLTAAALVGALLLARRAAQGQARAGLGLALLGGLGLGLHASFRLLLFIPLALLVVWRLRKGDRWPLLAPLLFAIGALVLAYLPVAAARHPAGAPVAANWGDPRTLGRLLDHLLAVRIRRAFADQILSHDLGHVLRQGRRFLVLCEAQLGAPALGLGALGLLWLLVHRRVLGLLVACLLGGELIYAAWINPMGVLDLQCGVPAALAVAVTAGVGVAAVARRLERLGRPEAQVEVEVRPAAPPEEEGQPTRTPRRLAAWALGAALGAVAVIPAALADSEARFALGSEGAAWSTAALRDVPPRALVLVRSDDLAAGALYLGAAWGLRPDVTVLVRQELWDAEDFARRVARGGGWALDAREVARWAALSEVERMSRERELLGRLVLRHLSLRPVLWEPGDDAPPTGTGVLVPSLPLYRLVPGTKAPPLEDPRPFVQQIDSLLGRSRDPLVERLATSELCHLAALYLGAGEDRAAATLYDVALRLWPGDAVARTGLGVLAARRGAVREALALAEGVLADDPERQVARLNAARYRLLLGDLDGAKMYFERAEREQPRSAAPLVGLARVARARGDLAAARRLVDRALATAPADPEARALGVELGSH